jgi:hypothetical protein
MCQLAAMQLAALAPPAGGPAEADWIRWAGVALAFTGTFIAAPKGVAHILRSAGEAYVSAAAVCLIAVFLVLGKTPLGGRRTGPFEELFGTVGRILNSKEFGQILKVGTPMLLRALEQAKNRADTRKTPGEELSAGIQVNWAQCESAEARVEYLHSVIGQAVEQISALQRAAESTDARLKQAARDLHETTKKLQRRMDEADLGAAKADARGVILIGIGTILTGIPDELAAVAWIGWLAFAIAVLLFSGVTLAVTQERHAVARDARRSAQGGSRPEN